MDWLARESSLPRFEPQQRRQPICRDWRSAYGHTHIKSGVFEFLALVVVPFLEKLVQLPFTPAHKRNEDPELIVYLHLRLFLSQIYLFHSLLVTSFSLVPKHKHGRPCS